MIYFHVVDPTMGHRLDILIDKLVPTDIMQPKNKPPRQVAQVGIFQTQYQ